MNQNSIKLKEKFPNIIIENDNEYDTIWDYEFVKIGSGWIMIYPDAYVLNSDQILSFDEVCRMVKWKNFQ